MSTKEKPKQGSMLIQLDAANEQKLEKAASYSDKKLSEFVLAESLAAAENTTDEDERICLSNADWTSFWDALENPPARSVKLLEALALHKHFVVRE